ncbi:AMP-binding protein [Alteromonas sp. CI.11.F.A3]|uniref:AMP-binding protein n=1 Tax=Alteromonas sp. CI.11.F.A3 TaxID=3079555 RepID=UPI0029427D4D|nr:AMP-binding protein [Alteromonas sp. CI.11.F.A3]WOI38322.1 AMP-binding protein [Alteromonas sp. CI.11.F.A3]
MLSVDSTFYSTHDFERFYQQFSSITALHVKHVNIAVCLYDTATWLALCLYAKNHEISVLPIHPDTPLELAKRTASRAKCTALFYGDMHNQVTVEYSGENDKVAGLIQMSSGTTGEPKCIKRSWVAIDIEIASYISHFQDADDMTPFVACPVTHSYGLICGVLVALGRGKSPTVITNINPKFIIKNVMAAKKPLLYSSPAMLSMISLLWPKNSSLYAAMTSGTLMSKPALEKVRGRITHLYQQYGCSESGCVSLSRIESSNTSIGKVLPHVQISSGLDASHPKEIVITIPAINASHQPQVIHTNDLGYFEQEENGSPTLHFVARQDDTIIVSGLNVYPQEIEDIVLEHPSVLDAVLFKVNDSAAGQRACLYFTTDTLDADALRTWCSGKLAKYQIPQFLHAVAHIERLPNGKVNRKKLAENYAHQKQQNALEQVTG